MPISTTSISLEGIATEFGGAKPHGLSEYYRGGGIVAPTVTEVPASGDIDIGSFAGLTSEIVVTFTLTGGGGCGGSGYDNGNGGANTRQRPGLSTGIMLKSTYDTWSQTTSGQNILSGATNNNIPASNFITATTSSIGSAYAVATGGLGGINGGGGSQTTGTAGESTEFGAGGAGGAKNSAGGPPNWGHWGAGGGSGGGDNRNFFLVYETDGPGSSGTRGERGLTATGTATLTPGWYALVVGRGGNRYAAGNYNGGIGSVGVASSLIFSNNTSKKVSFIPAVGALSYDQARLTTYVGYMEVLAGGTINFQSPPGQQWTIVDV